VQAILKQHNEYLSVALEKKCKRTANTVDTKVENPWLSKAAIEKEPGLWAPYLNYLPGVNLEEYDEAGDGDEEEDTSMAEVGDEEEGDGAVEIPPINVYLANNLRGILPNKEDEEDYKLERKRASVKAATRILETHPHPLTSKNQLLKVKGIGRGISARLSPCLLKKDCPAVDCPTCNRSLRAKFWRGHVESCAEEESEEVGGEGDTSEEDDEAAKQPSKGTDYYPSTHTQHHPSSSPHRRQERPKRQERPESLSPLPASDNENAISTVEQDDFDGVRAECRPPLQQRG
jgi:hypothetical protein